MLKWKKIPALQVVPERSDLTQETKRTRTTKKKKTTSLQRRRSVLSISPSSLSIQKPERGRSRSHVVINYVVRVAVKLEHHFLVVHCLC